MLQAPRLVQVSRFRRNVTLTKSFHATFGFYGTNLLHFYNEGGRLTQWAHFSQSRPTAEALRVNFLKYLTTFATITLNSVGSGVSIYLNMLVTDEIKQSNYQVMEWRCALTNFRASKFVQGAHVRLALPETPTYAHLQSSAVVTREWLGA